MNIDFSKLPKFKYHPNIYNFPKYKSIVNFDENTCQCCGKKTNAYISSIYSAENVDCICMSCVADGSASEKFSGEYIQDAQEVSDIEKRNELFLRTPGYISWQGEYWLACCDDYCEYIGDVTLEDIRKMNIEYVLDDYRKEENWQDFQDEWLSGNGSTCGYLFRCLHCQKYKINTDCD